MHVYLVEKLSVLISKMKFWYLDVIAIVVSCMPGHIPSYSYSVLYVFQPIFFSDIWLKCVKNNFGLFSMVAPKIWFCFIQCRVACHYTIFLITLPIQIKGPQALLAINSSSIGSFQKYQFFEPFCPDKNFKSCFIW